MLTVLSPLFLIGIPLSLLYLLWLYKKNTNYIKQNVGSNFLFKKLELIKQKKSKLKIPPRFFLDLLLLSLFFIVLANFLLKREVKNVEIILDNSYSTKALMGDGNTRLGAIIEKAVAEIEKNSTKTFSIYTSSPSLKLIESKVNASRAKRAIYNVKSTNSKSNLSLASLSYPIIIGDEKVKNNVKFKYHSVYKSPLNNVGILRATYNNGLNVTIFNFSNDRKAPIRLVVYDDLNSIVFNDLIYFANQTILTKSFKINKSGEYLIKVLPSEFDAISKDNELSVNIEQTTNKIALFGKRRPSELNLDYMDKYSFVSERTSFTPSFVIYDNVLPKKIEFNTLINLPSKNTSFFSIKNTYEDVFLSSINRKSLITNYLNLSNVKLNKALVFNRSNLAYPLIESEKGPILIETLISDKKVIVSGFDLFPFSGKENLFNSILTLNIFRELSLKGDKVFGLNLPASEFDTSGPHSLNIRDFNLKKSSFSISSNNLSHYFLKVLLFLLLIDLIYLLAKGTLSLIRGRRKALT